MTGLPEFNEAYHAHLTMRPGAPEAKDGLTHYCDVDLRADETVALCRAGRNATRLNNFWALVNCPDCRDVGLRDVKPSAVDFHSGRETESGAP